MIDSEYRESLFNSKTPFLEGNFRPPITDTRMFVASASPWRQQAMENVVDHCGRFRTPIPIPISGPEMGEDAGDIALGKVRQAALYALDQGLGTQKPGQAMVIFGGDSFNFVHTRDGIMSKMQKPQDFQDFEKHRVLWERNLHHGLPINAQKGYAVGLYAYGVPPIEITSTDILKQQVTNSHFLEGLFHRDNFDYASHYAGSMPGPDAIETESLFVYDSSGSRLSKQEALQAVMAAESRQAERLIIQAYGVLRQYIGHENVSKDSAWMVPLEFNSNRSDMPPSLPGKQPLQYVDVDRNIQIVEQWIKELSRQKRTQESEIELENLHHTLIRLHQCLMIAHDE